METSTDETTTVVVPLTIQLYMSVSVLLFAFVLLVAGNMGNVKRLCRGIKRQMEYNNKKYTENNVGLLDGVGVSPTFINMYT